MSTDLQYRTTVILPSEAIALADRLVEAATRTATLGGVTRSDVLRAAVLRAAVLRGLAALAGEMGVSRG